MPDMRDRKIACTWKQLSAANPEILPEPTLWEYVARRNSNGLAEADAVVKIGRQLVLKLDKFEVWFEQKTGLPPGYLKIPGEEEVTH